MGFSNVVGTGIKLLDGDIVEDRIREAENFLKSEVKAGLISLANPKSSRPQTVNASELQQP